MDETMALDDVRAAWDAHAALVTKALDKIAKLSAGPATDDCSAKIEEFVAKIKDSNDSMSKVLDALDPVPAPVPTPDPVPAPTPDPVPAPVPTDGGDGSTPPAAA